MNQRGVVLYAVDIVVIDLEAYYFLWVILDPEGVRPFKAKSEDGFLHTILPEPTADVLTEVPVVDARQDVFRIDDFYLSIAVIEVYPDFILTERRLLFALLADLYSFDMLKCFGHESYPLVIAS